MTQNKFIQTFHSLLLLDWSESLVNRDCELQRPCFWPKFGFVTSKGTSLWQNHFILPTNITLTLTQSLLSLCLNGIWPHMLLIQSNKPEGKNVNQSWLKFKAVQKFFRPLFPLFVINFRSLQICLSVLLKSRALSHCDPHLSMSCSLKIPTGTAANSVRKPQHWVFNSRYFSNYDHIWFKSKLALLPWAKSVLIMRNPI